MSLDTDQADRAHARPAHGPNALPQARPRRPLLRFLAQFNSALIYFLLAAALGAWILGHLVDAAVILAVVVVNALVGFIQEGKAEKALDAMRRLISPQAAALRDGARRSVPLASLVPGDVVPAAVAAQLGFTYAPVMQQWFATRPVAPDDGLVILGCGVALMLVLEGEKLLLRRLGVPELQGSPA